MLNVSTVERFRTAATLAMGSSEIAWHNSELKARLGKGFVCAGVRVDVDFVLHQNFRPEGAETSMTRKLERAANHAAVRGEYGAQPAVLCAREEVAERLILGSKRRERMFVTLGEDMKLRDISFKCGRATGQSGRGPSNMERRCYVER